MSYADIIEVSARGEVCLDGGKTEVGRDVGGYGCGLEGGTSVFSQPINGKIAVEGLDGYHHDRKRRSSGECRFDEEKKGFIGMKQAHGVPPRNATSASAQDQ